MCCNKKLDIKNFNLELGFYQEGESWFKTKKKVSPHTSSDYFSILFVEEMEKKACLQNFLYFEISFVFPCCKNEIFKTTKLFVEHFNKSIVIMSIHFHDLVQLITKKNIQDKEAKSEV